MIVVFVIGYTLIVFEHVNKINKAAMALFMGVSLWTILAIGGENILQYTDSSGWKEFLNLHGGSSSPELITNFITHHSLLEHLADISSIVFFLLGAMTIVELIDRFQGFRIITNSVHTSSRVKLLWIIAFLTFFMSAVLDNLTTTIIMIALLRKLLSDKESRWYFAGIVVIAANSGGAWSPIGDVTTIMLWIGGQLTAPHIISELFLPSFISMIIPLLVASFLMRGKTLRPILSDDEHAEFVPYKERLIVLILGVLALLAVPILKSFTHLPPFMGMLLGLGALWIYTDRRLKHKKNLDKRQLSVVKVLKQVDVATILFFLGILTGVGALQTSGHLAILSTWLDETVSNFYGINIAIGLISSVVDNVPLVAASISMYDVAPAGETLSSLIPFIQDGEFWTLLAYCSGTGGSILIVGSAAGVAAMGMEKIDFFWYLKKIGGLALIGYISGVIAFALLHLN